jgi:hypothetical protein
VRGRLFQGFQQRIERRRREHVDLVNDVDFELRLAGAYLQVSRSSRTCSTPLLLAPSISSTSSARPSVISCTRESSSKSTFGPPVQFRHFAKMRAMVVLPVPRGPQKR